jgi:MoaA/NifB/PqqE/SkfB family radical SAM enzyme
MFTNGTLLDRPIVERLARLGNLTPALSVEGRRERTDERRGAGVYDRVLQAMADLRTAGVPFGVSVTATRNNCEEILSDEFVDYFLGEQGAFYEFIFQFMPIGRAADLDLMPTAEQSAAFWRRSWDVIANKRMFLLDFWNHGPLVEGCVGAGRERGYLYIDWNGGVLPCVFAPFAAANINDVYEYGGTLNDVWNTPFFAAMRQWQRDYGFGQAQISAAGNWMQPCPFRDHHGVFREWIERFQPQPADDAAARSLTDPAYCQRLVAYGQEQEAVKQALWEEAYLGKPSAP